MRTCMIQNQRVIFHRWDQKSEIVKPSYAGRPSGIIRYPVAVIEYEDGVVATVPADNIVFLDTKKIIANLEKKERKWADQHDSNLKIMI